MHFVKNQHLSTGNNGWREISRELQRISSPKGINCYEWLDQEIKERRLEGEWSGFLHNPISYPEEYPKKYSHKVMPISKLVGDEYFKDKLKTCRSIFVFTRQIRNFLIDKTGFEKVFALKHPAGIPTKEGAWKGASRVLHVGQQMRKYHSFAVLNSKLPKFLIKPRNCPGDIDEMKDYADERASEIQYIEQMDLLDYIQFMRESIVFLNLYDVAACNTILECMSLSVPILVNRLDGCVEYLGEDYPLYYEDIEEAEKKIHDDKLISQANEYLSKMDKNNLQIPFFIQSLISKC